jgi:hypothetical protein
MRCPLLLFMRIDPIRHHLTVDLARKGYIDLRHPRWEQRHSHLKDLREYFFVMGQDLVEDIENGFIFLRQMTEFPREEGEETVAVIPVSRNYPLQPPAIALCIALRQLFIERKSSADEISEVEFVVAFATVIERASKYWRYAGQDGTTEHRLQARLEKLCGEVNWLNLVQSKECIAIHPIITHAIGSDKIREMNAAVKAYLENNELQPSEETDEP